MATVRGWICALACACALLSGAGGSLGNVSVSGSAAAAAAGGGGATGAGVASSECLRRAPHSLSASERKRLCGEAVTAGPAECARAAISGRVLGSQSSRVVELCGGASTRGPADCAAAVGSRLPPDLALDLCSSASSAFPAHCVLSAEGFVKDAAARVHLCAGTEDSLLSPARCAAGMPRWVSEEDRVALCTGAVGEGPADCAKKLGKGEAMVSVCQGAESSGPAECFRAAGKASTALDAESRAALCRNASNDAPFRCFVAVSGMMSLEDRISLCSGELGSKASATCAKAAPISLSGKEIVGLCRAAPQEEPLAPVRCFKSTSLAAFDSEWDRISFCSGPGAASAEFCAKAVPRGRSLDISRLCTGADASSDPRLAVSCAKKVKMAGFSSTDPSAASRMVADLCRADEGGAAAAECFNMAPRELSPEQRVQICAGATSTEPAKCAKAAMPHSRFKAPPDGGQCPFEGGLGRASGRHLSPSVIVDICKGDQGPSAARCALAAPASLQDGDISQLCRGKGGEHAAECAKAAPWGLSGPQRAELCSNAESTAPAECARSLEGRFGSDVAVATCQGARSDAPAACLNGVGKGGYRGATELDVLACRSAVPVASGLKLEHLAANAGIGGPPSGQSQVFTGMPVEATLSVLDQWGRKMTAAEDLTPTFVIASVGSSKGNENDVELDPDGGRYNVSVGGIVNFESLTFTAPGNVTLFFTIGSTHERAPSVAAKVIVLESEEDYFSRTCIRSVFDHLVCPEQISVWSSSEQEGATAKGEALLLWPDAFPALICQEHLERRGILYLTQSTSRDVRVWYYPGIEVLETKIGLPHKEMTPREVLGVDAEASLRQIRKAYYRLSLLWHPDRWERYPTHRRRAQDVFTIVADAYLQCQSNNFECM